MPVAKLPGIFPAQPRTGSDRGPLCPTERGRRSLLGMLLFVLAFGAALGSLAQDGHPTAPQTPVSLTAEAKPQSEGAAKPLLQKGDAAEAARKKQISDESSQLLAMALSLKAEVDKTNKDTLSLKVIRRADEIERLAKTVKEKIKPGAGS